MQERIEFSRHRIPREWRSVANNLLVMQGLDFTSEQAEFSLGSLFAEYKARLKEQGQSPDKPDIVALHRLSSYCTPAIFPKDTTTPYPDSSFFSNPAKHSNHELFTLALFTQRLAPGAAYLKGVENIVGDLPLEIQGQRAVVVEWHMDKLTGDNSVARVPLILNGGFEKAQNTVAEVVSALRLLESPVRMDLEYLEGGMSVKNLRTSEMEGSAMAWLAACPTASLEEPIAQAVVGRQNGVRRNNMYFNKLSFFCGETTKTWYGCKKGIMGALTPNDDMWSEWSLYKTISVAGQISTENFYRGIIRLMESSVHLPLHLLAVHGQIVTKGIKDGLQKRFSIDMESDFFRR